MSKWINKSLFDRYVQQKEKEEEQKQPQGMFRSEIVWKTPLAGTADKAKVYEGRFLPDKKGNFTKRYFYHMFKSGEKWVHYLCPKTENFANWCPMCVITSKLYMGTQKDKNAARNYKRKAKHVGNFFVVDDPRDAEIKEEKQKVGGLVKIYEFPDQVESKIKSEITDRREGLGESIFDPGEGGFNFILKVKSTKPDASGKTYPDYSDSVFSRKTSSLGSEADIKRIVETSYDLDEYIQGLKIPNETLITALKADMLWDMIREEWETHMGKQEEARTPGTPFTNGSSPMIARMTEEKDVPDFEPPKKQPPKSDRTAGDEELLAELDKI